MPKKTRRMKMRAQERRHHSVSLAHTSPISPLTAEEQQVKSVFLQDVKSSILVTLLIFTLEIAVYFASMSNYVSRLFGITL